MYTKGSVTAGGWGPLKSDEMPPATSQEDLELALQERTKLLHAAKAILSADDRDKICREFIVHMNGLIVSDTTTLYLVDHERQEVTLSAFYRRPEAEGWILDEGIRYPELMSGISGRVFRSGQPVLSVCPEDGIEPAETMWRRIQSNSGSLIVIPLITTTGIIGTITAHNRRTSRVFTERDVDLLMVLAHQAAAAIQRAQLTDEVKRHHDHLEELVDQRTMALAVAKELAETANRAKGAFLANMSHELRTPMNAIMGLTEVILRQNATPDQAAHLARIKQASRQLLKVIDDVLDVSMIEAGRLTLEEAPFTLGEILGSLSRVISQQAAEKGIDFLIECKPGADTCRLFGDAQRLSQILVNLTNNAVKFTERGRIVVCVELTAAGPDRALLKVDVHDTGIGIAPADHARIFLAFEQADTTLSRKYSGTGLGLAISRQLAQLMGGDIHVESTLGNGSCFVVTLEFKCLWHHGDTPCG